MDAGEEHGVAQAGGGDLVAVGVRDAFDQAVQAQPAEVVGGAPGRPGVAVDAEQLREVGAQVLVEEPAGVQPEDEQDVQECLGARVGQAQPGDAGPVVVDDRIAGGGQGFGAGDGVVAESLDGQQPSVGGVADLPQGGDLPRAFRTADLWLIHAAICCSMYSSWT